MLEQNEACLAGQPAEALIGKCVKVLIKQAQKWHISGKIVDASPKPEKVPADYFEQLEKKRCEELLKQFQADENPNKQLDMTDLSSEGMKLPVYLFAMLMHAFGVYLILRYLFL